MAELNAARLDSATYQLLMSSQCSRRVDDLERVAVVTDALSNPDIEVRLDAAAAVDGAYRCARDMGWTTISGEQLVLGAISAAIDRVDCGFASQTATAAVVTQPGS
jgi:hypothetical protein